MGVSRLEEDADLKSISRALTSCCHQRAEQTAGKGAGLSEGHSPHKRATGLLNTKMVAMYPFIFNSYFWRLLNGGINKNKKWGCSWTV